MKSSTSFTFSSLDPGEQQGLSPSIQIENLFKWSFTVGGLPGPLHTHCLMIVRHENPDDPAERLAIWSVNETAFGRPDEADLIGALRADNVVLASLVA
jgi:hypothetical protein